MVPASWLDTLSKKAGAAPCVLFGLLGLGLARGWLGWMLGALRGFFSEPLLFRITGKVSFDFGEMAGALLCVLFLYRCKTLRRFGSLVVASIGLMLLGTAVVLLRQNGVALPSSFAYGLIFLSGIGYLALFLVWVEQYGCYSPVNAMIACMGSYVVSTLIWFYMQDLPPTLTGVTVVALPMLSLLSFVFGFLVSNETVGSLQQPTGLSRYSKVFIWVWVFAFAYGMGAAYTQLSYSTVAAKIGSILPLIVLLMGLCLWRDHLDYSLAYRLSLVTMIAGFVIGMVNHDNAEFMQICFSASNAVVMTFALTLSCGIARLKRISAASLYGIISLGWYVVANFARFVGAVLLEGFEVPASLEVFVASAMIVLLLVVALFLFKEVDFLGHWSTICSLSDQDELAIACDKLANSGGLSKREASILVLLARGTSPQEISEKLFIAPGTVRAHVNHIYEKLGVHSKEELKELFEGTPLLD